MWRQAAGSGWSEFRVCSSLISCYHAQADQHQVQYSTSRYSTATEQHQIQYSNSCQDSLRMLAVDDQSRECVPHSSLSCYHAQADQHQVQYSTSRYSTPTVDRWIQDHASIRLATDMIHQLKAASKGFQYTTKPAPGTVHLLNTVGYSKPVNQHG